MLKRNLVANFLGQFVGVAVGIVFVPLYVRYLGVEAFGVVGFFAALQGWLALLDFGISPTLVREISRFRGGTHTVESVRDLIRSAECIVAALAGAASIAVFIAAPFLAHHWLRPDTLSPDELSHALRIMSLVAGLRFIEVLHRSVLLGLEHQVLANLVGAALSIARAVGAIGILSFVSPTLAAFFWWQLAMSVASTAVLVWSAYSVLPTGKRAGRPSRESVRQVRGYAAKMSIGALLGFGLTQVDKVILSRALSLEDYGLFVVASTAAGGVTMLVGPLTQAYFPRLCQLHAARDEIDFSRVFHVGSQLTTVVVGTAGLVLAARSEALLFAWTGSSEIAQSVSTVTSVLALANTLNAVTWILYQAQLAHGWLRFGLVCNSIAVCAVVPAMVVSASSHGAIGAAVVWLALNLAFVTIAPPIVFRRIMVGQYWSWLWGDVLAPLGVAALVLWVMRLLPTASEPDRFGGFLRCAAEGMVALVCAAIATPRLRGVLRNGLQWLGLRLG